MELQNLLQKEWRRNVRPRPFYKASSRAWVNLLDKPIISLLRWAGVGFLLILTGSAVATELLDFLETGFMLGTAAAAAAAAAATDFFNFLDGGGGAATSCSSSLLLLLLLLLLLTFFFLDFFLFKDPDSTA